MKPKNPTHFVELIRTFDRYWSASELPESCPMDDFLDDSSPKVRWKFFKWIEQLELHGPNLPRPYADVLRDKIRELRLKFGPNQYRFSYFFFNKKIIMTHGLIKKTDEVPESEIELAIKYRNDFMFRLNRGEIEYMKGVRSFKARLREELKKQKLQESF